LDELLIRTVNMSVSFAPTTPTTPINVKRLPKRGRHDRGSDSSVDGELSYLDLDTGSILLTRKPIETPLLSAKTIDTILFKLAGLETSLKKLDKLDEIEVQMKTFTNRVERVETRLDKTENESKELQKAVTFLSEQYDTAKTKTDKVTELEKQVEKSKAENEAIRQTVTDLMDMNKKLKEELLDIKCRDMRDNLVFTNISQSADENIEAVLREFLATKLNISDVSIERAHRIRPKQHGARDRSRPLPIVAKFSFFKEREKIRTSGRLLAGTNFSIQEQFPEEIEKRRKPLYPMLRQARKERKRAALVKDRLFVDGKEVRPPTGQPTQFTAGEQARAGTNTGHN